jgi:hypothetical protein
MILHERNDLFRRIAVAAVAVAWLTYLAAPALHAQSAPAGRGGPARGAASAMHADATLAQLMKGIFFTNSNVVFEAQNVNPADVPPAKDPSVATDPLANSYGKWEAVENSGLALAEGANLLLLPGRKCSNGRAVPLANADWAKLVEGVRQAGLKVYAAAKAKDQDKILDAADTMTNSCSNCHDKYREKPTVADRCK